MCSPILQLSRYTVNAALSNSWGVVKYTPILPATYSWERLVQVKRYLKVSIKRHSHRVDPRTFNYASSKLRSTDDLSIPRPLDLDKALYLAAEAGIATRKELQKRIMTSPSFSPDKSPFLVENMFHSAEARVTAVQNSAKRAPSGSPAKARSKNNAVTQDAGAAKVYNNSSTSVDTQPSEAATADSTDDVSSILASYCNPSSSAMFWHNQQQYLEESEGRGTCRRAVAHVKLVRGTGVFHLSRRGTFVERFPYHYSRAAILRPFLLTKTCGIYDVHADCVGGGFSGKASALRLSIARALVQANPSTAAVLQKELMLYEDVRQRWPKVPRRRGARKAYPYRKR